MRIKIINFFKNHWNKILPAFFFIFLFSAYLSTFAVFSPGQTLDPNCAPGTDGCYISGSPWLTSSSNIYHNGNVNVGEENASISSSISGGLSTTTNTVEDDFSNLSGFHYSYQIPSLSI